ncbi:hypothetical protein TrLO_g15290 [Triparma laevis f. longispina]|uniref:YwbE family protein n=1 Tax=Triparma laevis f. longispina TaxID=1714387 RepID=A0A9W7KSE1_9STRA|nr:hypothetical protein TrLO_g15290 [Triparma laevis f. longispina]
MSKFLTSFFITMLLSTLLSTLPRTSSFQTILPRTLPISKRALSTIIFNDPNNPKPRKPPVKWGRESSNWDAHSFPSTRKKRGRRGRGGGRGRRPPPPEPEYGEPGRGCFGKFVTPGSSVMVVKKMDQRTGIETKGIVQRLLTKAAYHPRGIKVMLVDGVVGRITVLDDEI